MIIHFLKKNNGLYYIIANLASILVFFVLYNNLALQENINNPWYYWLYFSTITQTTVGYSGIRSRHDLDDDDNKKTRFTDISILSIKSNVFRFCIKKNNILLYNIIFIFSFVYLNYYKYYYEN